MLRIILIALFLLPPQIANAAACYSAAEAEAEQGIRIHSELMVIGLNCTHMGERAGINLYGQYRQFSSDHGDLFAQYETILLNHFRKEGNANPEAAINTLRTSFANKISKDAAAMRPDIFCSKYAPRVIKASDMDDMAIRTWAATVYPTHPVSKPLCSG
ncbi:MAG: hypothetical protein ACPGRX_02730 [Bdellovibrionales bacterium]